MTPKDVADRVASELAACGRLNGAHGIDLDNIARFLVPPTREEFADPSTGSTCGLWVVLDEMPESPDAGYLVVFDDASGQFGLAVKGGAAHAGTVIGAYGGLVETLNCM